MAALCGRISVGLLERAEELFSAVPSRPCFALIAGCCSRVVALLLVFRRAVRLVLDNGADFRESLNCFLQSIVLGCGCMQDSAGHGSRPD